MKGKVAVLIRVLEKRHLGRKGGAPNRERARKGKTKTGKQKLGGKPAQEIRMWNEENGSKNAANHDTARGEELPGVPWFTGT